MTLPLKRLCVSADDLTVLTPESHEQCPGRGVAVTANYRGEVVVTHVCVDYAEHGHCDRTAAAIEAATSNLHEAGIEVVDQLPDTASTLYWLYNSANDKSPLTEDSHAECPGHAAYVEADWRGDPEVTYICKDFRANGHVSTRGASASSTVTDEYRNGERTRAGKNNAKWDLAVEVGRKWSAEKIFAETFGKEPTLPKQQRL